MASSQSGNSESESETSSNGSNEELEHTFKISREDQEKYEGALAYYTVVDMMPNDMVTRPGFQHFVKTCLPGFEIPSSIKMQILKNRTLQKQVLDLQKPKMKQAKFIAVTINMYQSIRAYFIDDDWKLQSINICNRTRLSQFVDECKLDRSCVVMYTKNAGTTKIKYVPRLSCFRHSLNRGINNAFKAVSLQVIIDKLKKIANTTLTSELDNELIINNLSTSTYRKNELKKLALKIQELPSVSKIGWWPLLLLIKTVKNSMLLKFTNSDFAPTFDEISTLNNLLEALDPIKKIIDQFGSETSMSASCIIPLYEEIAAEFHYIKNQYNFEAQTVAEKYIIMKQILLIFDQLYMYNHDSTVFEMLELCTVLDPRFKMTYIKETDKQRLIDILYEEMDRVRNEAEVHVQSENNLEISDYTSIQDRELARYIEIPEIGIEENGLDWWRLNSNDFPHLSKIARKYLCIQSLSTPQDKPSLGEYVSSILLDMRHFSDTPV